VSRVDCKEQSGLLLVGTLQSFREFLHKDRDTKALTGERSYFADINVGGLSPESVRFPLDVATASGLTDVTRLGSTVAVWVQPRSFGREINLTATGVAEVEAKQPARASTAA